MFNDRSALFSHEMRILSTYVVYINKYIQCYRVVMSDGISVDERATERGFGGLCPSGVSSKNMLACNCIRGVRVEGLAQRMRGRRV